MTTLLPILLALGMHPAQTIISPPDPKVFAVPPAPEKAAAPDTMTCALPHCTPTAPLVMYNNNLTSTWSAPPKPKRKAKPVVPEMEWAICAYDGTDGSILSCAVDARFLFSPDQHPEGVGDSKQPAPGLMPVLTAIREDDLAYTVIILIGLGLLAWFVLHIGADIINAILGTGRKQ